MDKIWDRKILRSRKKLPLLNNSIWWTYQGL